MAKPLVPWMGGKRRLADRIIPLFPKHTCYVEPFCGAAAIFFLKPPSSVEVLNDVNGDIVNLYRVVKFHLEELYRQFKWVLCSRKNWEWLSATQVETLTDIQRAARFLYLQKLAFGGMVGKQSFGYSTTSRPKFNIFTLEQDLADAHFRLANTTIENQSWEKIIERYDRAHTLFYCDPPYWDVKGYGVAFPWEQYEKLKILTESLRGEMLISINDHPDIRDLFKDFDCIDLSHTYTLPSGNESSCTELLFGTWKNGRPTSSDHQTTLF